MGCDGRTNSAVFATGAARILSRAGISTSMLPRPLLALWLWAGWHFIRGWHLVRSEQAEPARNLALIGAAGGLTAAAIGGRNRAAAAVAGAALVASSAFTRFGIFYAGRASARDPKYTVVPQKDRIRQRRRLPDRPGRPGR